MVTADVIWACLQGSRIGNKEAVLVTLCSRSFSTGKTIVFFRTKQRAHRAKILFGLAGLPPTAELHGNMSQSARLESLDKFRKVCCAFDFKMSQSAQFELFDNFCKVGGAYVLVSQDGCCVRPAQRAP